MGDIPSLFRVRRSAKGLAKHRGAMSTGVVDAHWAVVVVAVVVAVVVVAVVVVVGICVVVAAVVVVVVDVVVVECYCFLIYIIVGPPQP